MAITPENAGQILDLGKRLAGRRFPALDPDPKERMITAGEWANALNSKKPHYPLELWLDAVRKWCTEAGKNDDCTPAELIRAASSIWIAWEGDPVRGEKIRLWRERQVTERDRQLAEGTFAQIRGYRPRELAQKPAQTVTSGLKYQLKGSG